MRQLFRSGDLSLAYVETIQRETGMVILKFPRRMAPRLKVQKSITIISKGAFQSIGNHPLDWDCTWGDFSDNPTYHSAGSDITPMHYIQGNNDGYDHVACSGISGKLYDIFDKTTNAGRSLTVIVYNPFPPVDYYKNLSRYMDLFPSNNELMLEPLMDYEDWQPEELAFDESNPTGISDTILDTLEEKDCCILQGPPGTGKSYTIAKIVAHYLENDKNVCVTTMANKGLIELIKQEPLKDFISQGKIYKTNITKDEYQELHKLFSQEEIDRMQGTHSALMSNRFKFDRKGQADRIKHATSNDYNVTRDDFLKNIKVKELPPVAVDDEDEEDFFYRPYRRPTPPPIPKEQIAAEEQEAKLKQLLASSSIINRIKNHLKSIFGFNSVEFQLAGGIGTAVGNQESLQNLYKTGLEGTIQAIDSIRSNLNIRDKNGKRALSKDQIEDQVKMMLDLYRACFSIQRMASSTTVNELIKNNSLAQSLKLSPDKNGNVIGVKFNPRIVKAHFMCTIAPIIFKLENGRQLLAVLLHEIGHNFSVFILQHVIKTTPGGGFLGPERVVDSASRADEIFADNFVAMYGYGPDLIEGMILLGQASDQVYQAYADHYNNLNLSLYGRVL